MSTPLQHHLKTSICAAPPGSSVSPTADEDLRSSSRSRLARARPRRSAAAGPPGSRWRLSCSFTLRNKVRQRLGLDDLLLDLHPCPTLTPPVLLSSTSWCAATDEAQPPHTARSRTPPPTHLLRPSLVHTSRVRVGAYHRWPVPEGALGGGSKRDEERQEHQEPGWAGGGGA